MIILLCNERKYEKSPNQYFIIHPDEVVRVEDRGTVFGTKGGPKVKIDGETVITFKESFSSRKLIIYDEDVTAESIISHMKECTNDRMAIIELQVKSFAFLNV